ncbi:MAG: sigma-70 family RNA polymerase sigma factor [Vampirovibrionia bacterium]
MGVNPEYKQPTKEDVWNWFIQYKSCNDTAQQERIRNRIVQAYLPLVKKISHGLARRSTDPVEDLIQVGSVGLLKAIDQFSLEGGANFKTYATYLITGEIRHYIRDKATMIKAPRELQELSLRINKLIEKLSSQLGRHPTDLEIAESLQVPVDRVFEATEANRRKSLVSLDQVISSGSEGEQFLVDKLVDNKYQDYLLVQEDRIMLNEAIESLETNLKDVIKLTYYNDMSQNEIAQQLGISQMQVSRRLKKAISELFKIISQKKVSKVET